MFRPTVVVILDKLIPL
uniref:Uncharacterized protein n=1 Tax=Anguilla anguilla TaxID=7936 RepID=A0A0E9TLC9_ANGAN